MAVADISVFCCLHYTLITAKGFADNQRIYQNVRKNSIGTLKKETKSCTWHSEMRNGLYTHKENIV